MKQVHKSSIVDNGAEIGEGTKVWHFCHISSTSKIGSNCTLGQNVYIGENVKIGNNVKIQNNVSVFSGVEIEDNVFVGPSVVFTNVRYPHSLIDQKDKFEKTLLKEGCSIGANSTILCGVVIGENTLIGSHSLVTKSTKNNSIYRGSPAVFIRPNNN